MLPLSSPCGPRPRSIADCLDLGIDAWHTIVYSRGVAKYRTASAARTSAGISETVANHVATFALHATSPEVTQRARLILADMLGVMAYSSSRPAVVRSLAGLTGHGSGQTLVVGHGRVATPDSAALINGIAGHDLEFDDGNEARCHTEPLVVASALAVAELRAERSFDDMLAGLVVGYDVENRLSKAIGPETMYERGFHPSTVCGTVGAAATASRVLGLSEEQTRHALGLAASQACGLLTYFGDPSHISKSFQIGVAARNGVSAALLARSGYTSAPEVFADRYNTVMPFGGPDSDPSRMLDGLGERFEIMETSLKRHAGSGLTHAAVDLVLEMSEAGEIDPHKVQRIDVTLPEKAVPRVEGAMLPTHNVRHIVGIAVTQGQVGPQHFEASWLSDPNVRAIANAVRVHASAELQQKFPELKGAVVRLTRTDGSVLERSRQAPRGSPREPLSVHEIHDKFTMLAGEIATSELVDSIWDTVTTSPGNAPVARIYELVEEL